MPTIDQARAWYPANDAVHGFDHVLRVYRLAEYLGLTEGGYLEIVRTAVLLNDVQDEREIGDQRRLAHHHASAEFARPVLLNEGWSEDRIAAVQDRKSV